MKENYFTSAILSKFSVTANLKMAIFGLSSALAFQDEWIYFVVTFSDWSSVFTYEPP
jgi:hypothetical protein